MPAQDEYIMLMASFPALGGIFARKHTPLNRFRMEQLLHKLRSEHKEELLSVSELLAWRRLAMDEPDASLVRRAKRLVPKLSSDTIKEAVNYRLEVRTLIAALRRRHLGHDAPGSEEIWGYGRWVNKIRTNWREVGFSVERIFPWVLTAKERLEENDTRGLEELVLDQIWTHAGRLAAAHTFDYEAVALYVIRWNLIDRWVRYDADAAAVRFNELVDESLSKYRDLCERV